MLSYSRSSSRPSVRTLDCPFPFHLVRSVSILGFLDRIHNHGTVRLLPFCSCVFMSRTRFECGTPWQGQSANELDMVGEGASYA